MSNKILDGDRTSELWETIKNFVYDKITETDGTTFTTDDTLTMSADKVLGVSTPAQGVLSQEEFDALPEEKRNKGLYVIPGGSSSGGLTEKEVQDLINAAIAGIDAAPTVEEYDTDDGWHVRKYSDGFVYMVTTISEEVTTSSYTEWAGGYAIPAEMRKYFPFTLTKKYGESATNCLGIPGAITQWEGNYLNATAKYGLFRANAIVGTLKFNIQVFGRWK